MAWGSREDFFQALADDGDDDTPLARKPVLHSWLGSLWNAFHELSTCRPVGMAPGRIPWDAIDHWATRNGITDPDDYSDFLTLVRGLDDAWLEHVQKTTTTKET